MCSKHLTIDQSEAVKFYKHNNYRDHDLAVLTFLTDEPGKKVVEKRKVKF